MYTNYYQNKVIDRDFRAQSWTPPSTWYLALLTCSRGGRVSSTLYTSGDTMAVLANDGVLHLYACTTTGTSASSQGGLYPGVDAEVITDGAAGFTEQSTALRAGTYAEAAYTGYARPGIVASLANFAGTQSSGSTSASSGTSGTTSNNGAVNFGAPTSGPTDIWAEAWFDASSSGNMLMVNPLAFAQTIYSGNGAPSLAAGATTVTFK